MENKKSISKLSLLLNVVLIGIVAFSGTGCPDTPCPPCPSCPPLSSDCNCICTDYSGSPAFPTIAGSLLSKMALKYQETRRAIDGATCLDGPHDDAGSVWFALDTLKRFIWEIENRVCKKKDCDSLKLGVRIYYARYPELDDAAYELYPDLNGVRPEYSLKHTVFMVPTFNDPHLSPDQDTHFDFDLNNPNCPSVLDPSVNNIVALIGGRNHGTLCPPICGDFSASGIEGVVFGH